MPVLFATAPIDGAGYFRQSYQAWVYDGRRGLAAVARSLGNVILPPEIEVNAEAPIRAQIHEWRWVANCDDCRKDWSFIWLDDLRYLCVRCWNAAAGGLWRPVVVPSERRRAAIYGELAARPDILTRNWVPAGALGEDRKVRKTDESAAQLARETSEHSDDGG